MNKFKVYLNSSSVRLIGDGVSVTIQAKATPAFEGKAQETVEFLQELGVGVSVEVRHATGTRSCMNKPDLWNYVTFLGTKPEDSDCCKFYPLSDESGFVGINSDYFGPGKGLYVIPCGNGFTTLGFDVCLERAAAYRAWVETETGQKVKWTQGRPDHGEVRAYEYYLAMAEAGRALNAKTGKRCPAELVPELIGLEGRRVEIVYPDGEKVRFNVGRSTGWSPCHLDQCGLPVRGAEGATIRILD